MNPTLLSSALRRAVRNIYASPYLHIAVTATVAFSLLIIGAFMILYVNIGDLIRSWQQNVRMVAYLKDEAVGARIESLKQQVAELQGVKEVRFISKDEALARLRGLLKHRPSLLEGLATNPLPASLEIKLDGIRQDWGHMTLLAEQIKGFSEVEDVEYSQSWLHRISVYATFFRLASIIIGGLVVATAVFVSANTIRLSLYANRDELEIMRLVGATDSFIKAPFYIHNLFEGFLGGAIALGVLFASYKVFAAKLQAPEVLLGPVQIRFLSLWGTGALLLIGMAMAWLGSYLSLKQSLRP